jgi:UDP-2,3-diacylglucosamine pyrophosphatase LpxH
MLFVVSDIHLGEDLVQRGPPSLQTYITRLNAEFVGFVEWLRTASRPALGRGEPSTLAVNGDMFDFVKISLRPDPKEAYMRWRQGLSQQENRLGLDNSPDRVLWKLERIVENHRPAFLALARLVREGHTLRIIAGNHDREFYYDEVVLGLREMLADLAGTDGALADDERAQVMSRIDVSMWFHWENRPGNRRSVYIEHGHQYDPYCSFEYLLAPRRRKDEIKIALPLSHRAIPYFADLLGDLSTHNLDTKGMGHYIKLGLKFGPRTIGRLLWAYVRAVTSILKEAGGKGREAKRQLESEHLEERKQVATKYGISEQVLHELDALHATPAEFSLVKMIQCFYVDRFVLYGIALVVILMQAWLIDDHQTLMLSQLASALVTWVMSGWLGRQRRHDTREMLREGARGVEKILHPNLVIFGHSHKPELIALEDAQYMNIGSWVSRAALLGEAEWGMTFAWVGAEDAGKDGGLYRWVGTDNAPKIVKPLSALDTPSTVEQGIRNREFEMKTGAGI